MDNQLLIAKGQNPLCLHPRMANRHGLITGATGTGKTVTLKVMAESFSAIGTPVFLTDIKGDLSGLCAPGVSNAKMEERINALGLEDFNYQAYPVDYWDVFAEQGLPVRTTISEMGPLLLSRLLNLNDVQTGVLNLVFRIADDSGLLLLDLKDLRAMLVYVAENASDYTIQYGTISKQSVGAIQRALLVLEDQGGNLFFGEPALEVHDFIRSDPDGRGMINILSCDKLFQSPALYSTFLLWLLSELFEELPEVGDLDQPKIVFFFDEAHLLFDDAPDVLMNRIEQVVRLVRSKGVGVYFVTQNPTDIPDKILGQLGNRVQHALRAYTPREQKAIKAAAETFRQNPHYPVDQVITELAVGEALVSFLDEKGRPSVVERAFILPPRSLMGPIDLATRRELTRGSIFRNKYEQSVDRDSAYEYLQRKYAREAEEAEQEKTRKARERDRGNYDRPARRGRQPDTMLEKMGKTAINTLSTSFTRQLVRGVLGSLRK
ncbi:MAG: DUF853 family protein [Syntrophomonadaceae bacterium]|nr:DUF853 family protein [Syntrophomonadaceae bacterium]